MVEPVVRGRSPFRFEARDPRHGSGSRGRGRSQNRRELEARRRGDSGSRGRGNSHGRREEIDVRLVTCIINVPEFLTSVFLAH